jgi:YD repeat-containing protein
VRAAAQVAHHAPPALDSAGIRSRTPGQVYEYTDEHDRVDRFEGSGSTFRVTQTRWRGGYQRTYSYDPSGHLVEIDDNLGRSVLLTWQGSSHAIRPATSPPRPTRAG